MTALPWVLLASTITVRVLLARRMRAGFYLDLVSVAPWLAYYASNHSWPLLAVPLIFGALDVRALRVWWRI